jgi:PIN domain nuclease of toxin-antitoxin system
VLLDTHIFIWLVTEPDALSPQARTLCRDRDNELLLSIASIWEIQIKHQLGKLALAASLTDLVAVQRVANRIALLPITLAHVLAIQELPFLHKDPFDRMLVAQTRVEDITLLTADYALPAYQIRMVKA